MRGGTIYFAVDGTFSLCSQQLIQFTKITKGCIAESATFPDIGCSFTLARESVCHFQNGFVTSVCYFKNNFVASVCYFQNGFVASVCYFKNNFVASVCYFQHGFVASVCYFQNGFVASV